MIARQIAKIPPRFGRCLIGMAFAAIGFTFFFVGYLVVPIVALLGYSFMAAGGIAALVAIIYIWRGGRLGAEIRDDNLIVIGYFHREDITVPLAGLLRVYRNAVDDATVLEFPDWQFLLDDCYIGDADRRKALFERLQNHALHRT